MEGRGDCLLTDHAVDIELRDELVGDMVEHEYFFFMICLYNQVVFLLRQVDAMWFGFSLFRLEADDYFDLLLSKQTVAALFHLIPLFDYYKLIFNL